jgi:signal transduction histidine kinase
VTDDHDHQQSVPHRVLLGLVVVALPAFGVVVAANDADFDPGLWWRLPLSALAAGLLWADVRRPAAREPVRRATLALAVFLLVLFTVRAATLQMPPGAVVALLLIQTLTAAVLVSWVEVLGYLLIVGAALAWGHVQVPSPELPTAVVAVISTTLVLGMGGVSTARARAEGALRAARDELEQRVAERTEQLQREVVERRAAERAASAASRAKSRFLATMSHELRTPLNAVAGYTELVCEELEDREPEAIEDLAQVLQAAQRLTRMVDDVLDLARIESESLELTLEPTRLDACVQSVLQLVETERARRGNRWEQALEPVQWPTDGRRVEQIVVHLVNNALLHAPGTTVHLATYVQGDEAVVEVRDEGPGVPEGLRDVVFERFGRADDSSTRSTDGAGLGLAVGRELARRLGGSLTLDGPSTFRLRLPKPGV